MNTLTQIKIQHPNMVYSTRGIHYWSYFRVVSDFSGGRSDLNPNIQYIESYLRFFRPLTMSSAATCWVLDLDGRQHLSSEPHEVSIKSPFPGLLLDVTGGGGRRAKGLRFDCFLEQLIQPSKLMQLYSAS